MKILKPNSPKLFTRRQALIAGLATVGGVMLAQRSEEIPTYGNILRMGDNFTYRAQRLLLPRESLVREYERSDITSMPAVETTDPGNAAQSSYSQEYGPLYERLKAGDFENWKLSVEGCVARPGMYSLADLKRLPSRRQITKHTCEEGWSAITEWTGTPLRLLLEAAGMLPNARFVNFYAFDSVADSIDMIDALHPQTILAYGMNGRGLPLGHGAPLRLRVETQVGYKSMKYIRRIYVADKYDDMGPDGWIQKGWSWHAGI